MSSAWETPITEALPREPSERRRCHPEDSQEPRECGQPQPLRDEVAAILQSVERAGHPVEDEPSEGEEQEPAFERTQDEMGLGKGISLPGTRERQGFAGLPQECHRAPQLFLAEVMRRVLHESSRRF